MRNGHEGRLQTSQQGDPVSWEGPRLKFYGGRWIHRVIKARLAVLPGNSTGRDYRGFGNVAGVEMRSHPASERARVVTPHLPLARRSFIPTTWNNLTSAEHRIGKAAKRVRPSARGSQVGREAAVHRSATLCDSPSALG
jgi:hypothetical protein